MLLHKIIYLAILAGLVLFFILYAETLSLTVLIFAFLMPIVSFAAGFFARKKITAYIADTKHAVNKEDTIKVKTVIENKSFLPVPNVKIKLSYFNSIDDKKEYMSAVIPLQNNNVQSIIFSLSSLYCGKLVVKIESISYYDYFKLFRFRKKFSEKSETIILPQAHNIEVYPENTMYEAIESEMFSKVRSGDDCSEIFDIRDYRDGDKMNRIHWKLSIKQDNIMVREYSLPVDTSITLLFDYNCDSSSGDSKSECIDALIETLLSFSEALVSAEIVHKICWYDVKNAMLYDDLIQTSEDISMMFGKLLQSTSYTNECYTVNQYMAISGNDRRCSHIIYFSAYTDDNIIKQFSSFQGAEKKTMLYITPVSGEPETGDGVPTADEEFVFIPVETGRISQSIGEISV